MITHPDPATLREKIARAICRAWFYCDLDKPDGLDHWKTNKERCYAEADAVIAALSSHLASAGWRVVPVEPTNDINFCIHAAIERVVGSMIHDPIAPAAWKAGVAASPDPLAAPDRPTGETDG